MCHGTSTFELKSGKFLEKFSLPGMEPTNFSPRIHSVNKLNHITSRKFDRQ